MNDPASDPRPEDAGAAATLFGERLPLAIEYARRLGTDGVVRGLIGPREADRIWDRHLLNCAVVGDLIPSGASVTDVGSGAGLPGIVLAVARPDLAVVLVESLARRTAFLNEVVADLGLDNVSVVRVRAEDAVGTVPPADVVTARAVAPLDRLAVWCLPLARVGGRLLALKGATAAEEVTEHRAAVVRSGGAEPVVRTCGDGLLDEPTTVVEVMRERDVTTAPKHARSGGSAARKRSDSTRGGHGRRSGPRSGRSES